MNKIIKAVTYKKNVMVICLILCWTLTFGGAFSWDKSTINEPGYAVYAGCDADSLLIAAKEGDTSHTAPYIGRDTVMSGTVTETGYGSLTLRSREGAAINVSADKDSLSGIKAGDTVRVYGPVSYGSKGTLSVKAAHVKVSEKEPDEGTYYVFVPGNDSADKEYRDETTSARSIAGGRAGYRVPKAWASCLADEETSAGIFNLRDISDAECYFLNGFTQKTETECFVIFDLDYEEYLYDSEKGMTLSIERTIVSNICSDDMKNLVRKIIFPVEGSRNNTGLDADYYVGTYNNDYSVEFVFVPAKDHMCVMMYIHRADISARDDVLYVVRSLRLKE